MTYILFDLELSMLLLNTFQRSSQLTRLLRSLCSLVLSPLSTWAVKETQWLATSIHPGKTLPKPWMEATITVLGLFCSSSSTLPSFLSSSPPPVSFSSLPLLLPPLPPLLSLSLLFFLTSRSVTISKWEDGLFLSCLQFSRQKEQKQSWKVLSGKKKLQSWN